MTLHPTIRGQLTLLSIDEQSLPHALGNLLQSLSDSLYNNDNTTLQLQHAAKECSGELDALKEKLLDEARGHQFASTELGRILNEVNEGFFTRDLLTDKYNHMSVGCERIYGYKVADFYANTRLWYQVIHPDDLSIIDQEGDLLHSGKQVKSTYRIFHRDNTIRWIEVKAIPIFIDGQLCRVDGKVNDITEQKVAEQLLNDSEVKYRAFFENSMDGILLFGDNGQLLTANPAAREMFNAREEKIGGLSYHQLFVHNGSPAPTNRADLQNKEKAILLCKRPDGTTFYGEATTVVFRDARGSNLTSMMIRDITVRKKAEQQIADSEQFHRLIVETAQEGIWLTDENFTCIFANKKMCALLEYPVEELLGRSPMYFMRHHDQPLMSQAVERRKNGIDENTDIPFVTKTGKYIWTNLSSSTVVDQDKNFVGALWMVTDITKRKLDEQRILQSESDLDMKNKELERKNAELEQFAYVASHDLQEPLRTISSFVKLLKLQYSGQLDNKADKYLSFILESSNRMKVLINDLLDYSRIGNKPEMALVDCNQVLQDVIADLYVAIQDAGATIDAGSLPRIYGYPTEMKQLFQNLLINAIKFAKKEIAPVITITAGQYGNNYHFSFADNGIGIEKAHTKKIFIIFQRLHTRSEYNGSGIGLSHCKKIVELHRGKIWVESTPGVGSTFHFTIPVIQIQASSS